MSNFIPKSVFKTTNPDGSKSTTQEWNYGDLGSGTNVLNGGFLSILVFLLIISAISSPILLILSVITFSGRTQIINILGIIVSGYFIFDCYHNWLALSLANLFLDDNKVSFLMALNLGAFFGHIILLIISLFFGGYFLAERESKVPMIALGVIMLFFYIGFTFGNNIKGDVFKERNKDRVKQNISSNVNHDGNKKTETEKVEDNRIQTEESNERLRKHNENGGKEHDEEIKRLYGN